MICICFRLYPSRSCMRGLPRLRLVLNSKLTQAQPTCNLQLFEHIKLLHARLQLLGFKNGFSGHRGRTESRGQPVHVAAWLPPCRTSPKKAAPPQRVLDGPAAPGPRHGPFGPTARGSSTSRGNAGKCDSLHKAAAAAAAAAAALTYVPAELHAGGPLTGRRRCSASSIEREREGREPQLSLIHI